MSKMLFPNGTEAEIAEYKEQIIPDYRGNPLIEALPPIMDRIEVIDKLAVYPAYSESERMLEAHYRYHCIQRLFQYFQPLSVTLELESKISRIIRGGYLCRNPYNPEFIRTINEEYKSITANGDINNTQLFNSTASSFTIIGCSGIGKSSSINRILSTYPQIIVHSDYKGKNFSMYQVVYLKLDTAFDGSIKGICLEIMDKLDNLLGTSYYKRFITGRISTNAMLPVISKICRQCSLGVIILDEIQHLSMAKSGGSQKVLNFFVTLINLGFPVVMIGTPKATGIISGEFRQARRSEGAGGMILSRIEKDETFCLLLEGLWEYQWTRKFVPINEEFIDTMYDLSMGITDIIIKIFIMTQIRAISSGKEEISVALMKQVADENLKLVQPMIKALKSGNINKIAKFDDIADVNIDGFIRAEYSKIDLSRKVKELQQMHKQSQENSKEVIKEQVIMRLAELDIDYKKTEKYVEKVMNSESVELNVNSVMKQTLKEILNEEKQVNRQSKKIEVKKNDMRFMVKEGKKNNITAYQVLKNEGYIKDFNSIFERVG